MSGRGRGDAIKRIFQEPSSSTPQSSTDTPKPSDAPINFGGRGALLKSAAPSPHASAPLVMGRAKCMSSLLGISRVNPSNVPIERSAAGEVTRGTSRTRVSPQGKIPSEGCGSPSILMGELSLAEKGEGDPLSSGASVKGTSGSRLNIACNYVRLKTEHGKGIFQYDVKFKPDIDSRVARFQILKQLTDTIGDTKSFDGGALLYLPYQRPKDVEYFKAKLPSDGSDVGVKLTFVKSISMGDRASKQLYNVIFRRIMNILGMTLHGRKFFDPLGAKYIPEHRLEVWPGFVTSIEEYEGGVMLCCDNSYRVLRTQTVYEIMSDLATMSNNTPSWHAEFLKLIVNQRVLTKYNNKVYGIDDVDFNATPKNTFVMKSGTVISYLDYYKQQYNVDIVDHDQPLLKSQVKTRLKGEEYTSMVDLIPELCYMTGITDAMRADFKVMKAIAQYTRISPQQRQYALTKFLSNINSHEKAQSLLKSWGLSVDNQGISLSARVLKTEDVFFGHGAVHTGSYQADWTRAATSNCVLEPVSLRYWSIFCTKRDENVVADFVAMCRTVSSKLGIELSRPNIIPLPSDNTQLIINEVKKVDQKTQLVVIIFPVSRADKYSAVKKLCCVQLPIPSQVILTRTIRFPDKLRSVVMKIMLQINCKVGGTLWAVRIPVKNTIVLGMDAFHDSIRKTDSMGALVASLNSDLTRWYSKTFTHECGNDFSKTLESNILLCLSKYREVNGQLPDQILMYRDGVGDGHLPFCVNFEIPQIFSACQRIDKQYVPKLLFVVVHKRISTRIYAESAKEYLNPPSGTVMDHSVTRRDLVEFYLVSQASRLGTVSPTRYIVVHNSTSMDTDKIQRFTHKLTHMYYNWSGTVRVPAPCQYAHKLAALIGDAVHQDADESLADKLFFL